MHVVGQLPLPLGPFLFLASFYVLGIGEALSQELPALVVLTHLAMGHARFNKTGLRNKNNKNYKWRFDFDGEIIYKLFINGGSSIELSLMFHLRVRVPFFWGRFRFGH